MQKNKKKEVCKYSYKSHEITFNVIIVLQMIRKIHLAPLYRGGLLALS